MVEQVRLRNLETLKNRFERTRDKYGELPLLIRQNCTLFPQEKWSKVGWIHEKPELDFALVITAAVRPTIVREFGYLVHDTNNYDFSRQERLSTDAHNVFDKSHRYQFLRSYHTDYQSSAGDWFQFIAEIGLRRIPECAFKLSRTVRFGHPGYLGMDVQSFDSESVNQIGVIKDDTYGLSNRLQCDVSSGWYSSYYDYHEASIQVIDWLIELTGQGYFHSHNCTYNLSDDESDVQDLPPGLPSLDEQIERICDLLEAGCVPKNEACDAIRYSLSRSATTPGTYHPDSVHLSYVGLTPPQQSTIQSAICKRLGEICTLNRYDQLGNIEKHLRKLLALRKAELPSITKTTRYVPPKQFPDVDDQIFQAESELYEDKVGNRSNSKIAEYIFNQFNNENRADLQEAFDHLWFDFDFEKPTKDDLIGPGEKVALSRKRFKKNSTKGQ